jgi:predicted secreted Zn-dependent protease
MDRTLAKTVSRMSALTAASACAWACALVPMSAAVGVAHASVSHSVRYETYDVVQRPGQSLIAAIRAASPIRQDGKLFHGLTNWRVHWKYRWSERSADNCAISSATVTASATITLPRLVRGSPEGYAQWKPYIAALTEHEQGHYDIAIEAAHEIERRLRTVPPHGDCRLLKDAADNVARATMAEYKARDREYDRLTQHGRTQGASLPRD